MTRLANIDMRLMDRLSYDQAIKVMNHLSSIFRYHGFTLFIMGGSNTWTVVARHDGISKDFIKDTKAFLVDVGEEKG